MGRYAALLRGINVGGKNLIKMPALVACFETLRLEAVATYIQSGNVLFTTRETASSKLVARIEEALAATFGYRASIVLRSHEQMREIVARAPKGFGQEPTRYRYDVMYLKPDVKASAVIGEVPLKPGVDAAHAGTGVLYFSRLIARASQSRLSKIVSMPIYQSMTIRNWNTTTALVRLMDEAAPRGRGAARAPG